MHMHTALFLHLISAVIWIGGMFFAYVCLRPIAAEILEPPVRLNLWVKTFARFFPWVWVAVILLSLSGLWLLRAMGGFTSVGIHVHIMLGLGVVMILIFLHIFFVPYRRLRVAVADGELQIGATQLARIRLLVGSNLALGVLVLAVVRLLPGI